MNCHTLYAADLQFVRLLKVKHKRKLSFLGDTNATN